MISGTIARVTRRVIGSNNPRDWICDKYISFRAHSQEESAHFKPLVQIISRGDIMRSHL